MKFISTHEQIEHRLNVCANCDKQRMTSIAGAPEFRQCSVCYCTIQTKVRKASSQCPLEKWQK